MIKFTTYIKKQVNKAKCESHIILNYPNNIECICVNRVYIGRKCGSKLSLFFCLDFTHPIKIPTKKSSC